jgi:hypothetical protein
VNPEQFSEERTQQFSDDAQVESSDGAIEIAADTLEHVAGGAGGGGGVGNDP